MHKIIFRLFAAAAVLTVSGLTASAQSGMVGKAEELPPIRLSSGAPLADAPLNIKAGTYYEIKIEADGSAEMAISGPGFFRNCWIDEIVINDIEVRPMGVDSLEFDDEGEAEISFICIKPGKYQLSAPGTEPLEVNVEG